MLGHAAAWAYFGLAWAFLLLLLLKRWRERERRDQAATYEQLKRTAPPAPVDHRWDVI